MAFSDGPIQAIDRRKAATLALLKNWAGELENYAKGHKPWTDRTGHATQGLHAGVDENENEFELFLSHSMKYGEYLEQGTGVYGPKGQPFEIKAKIKKALSWAGAIHPVKSVINPGMKSKAVILPTLQANLERIKQTIRELWS